MGFKTKAQQNWQRNE